MDERLILTLIDKFAAGSLGELELAEGDARLVLRKEVRGMGPGIPPAAAGSSAHEAPVHLGLPAGSGGYAATGGGSSAGTAAASGEFITSPIVGTFYPAPSPDAPPFVRAGSKVKAGDTLCILEAMKMMNHLEAEFDCEILSVKAAAGDLVEFGQQLFEVKRLA